MPSATTPSPIDSKELANLSEPNRSDSQKRANRTTISSTSRANSPTPSTENLEIGTLLVSSKLVRIECTQPSEDGERRMNEKKNQTKSLLERLRERERALLERLGMSHSPWTPSLAGRHDVEQSPSK